MGRILLAGLAPDELQTFVAQAKIERRTPMTITDRRSLAAAVDKASVDGLAIVDEELELGLPSIAVPIVDRAGRTVAAIIVSTQAVRFSVDGGDIMPALRQAKARVEEFYFA